MSFSFLQDGGGSQRGPPVASVLGLSSLREAEKKKQPAELSEKQKALQAYLAAQYGAGDGAGEEQPKKKKKKKKEAAVAAGGGMRILDEDVSGFKGAEAAAAPSKRGGAAGAGLGLPGMEDEEDEEAPVIANPEEAERLKKVLEKEKQFYGTRDDGSGWQALGGSSKAAGPSTRDASPPRRSRHDSPDASPPRRQRHDSPDASPPRRHPAAAAADAPSPRRQRHDSPDASPPRRRPAAAAAAADASPPRRQRHDSPDASPPRRRSAPDASPLRRKRHGSPDAMPPRRARHDSPDASPPRMRPAAAAAAAAADVSPPRRGGRHDSPEDSSPPRRRSGAGQDEGGAAGEHDAKRIKLSDGTRAGMVSGRELMEEMRHKRQAEQARFAALGTDVTGQGAQTVFRDKEGRRVSKEEFLEQQAAEKKKNKAQYDDERNLAWGGGLRQRQEVEDQARAMAEEASRPFARYRDDADLDRMQRGQLRWGDPMAHLVKRQAPELEAPPSLVAAHAERLKKSGFIIPLEVPPHSWLRRGVGPPINRFGIRPGRHWDGVDRSNGFEADMFKRQNELKWREQQAYMMAQDDM